MNLVTPDSGLLFWMVLIFGIVFFLLWKFGFPIITDMVEKRTRHIDESLKLAQEAEERVRNIAAEQNALVEKARSEQNRIVKEASVMKEQILQQAREQAREETAQILQKARTEIAAEKESALRDIRKEVAMLSLEVAEKVVRKELSTDAAQTAYVDSLVNELMDSIAEKETD
ncbi:MAG: F0F1 ATP synthase subunit B [Bacteroidales bacterium]|nr:F0F1 ATP synthase subunit B [Bacteroidales bacterium]MBQ6576415.1 F0F1 ATP synthase subunit B [Bacteroidales bacterium]